MWIAIFAIPCVFLICWFMLHGWEPRIRITGMSLELMGLATVALGIRETRSLFGRPNLLQIGRTWLARFPWRQKNVRISTGSASITLGGASAIGHATVGPSQTATIEERIAILEKSLKQAHLYIHEANLKIEQESEKRQSDITAVKREFEDGDLKNKQLLEDAAAGGLYLETIGVLWLAIGIVLATASNEITQLCFGN